MPPGRFDGRFPRDGRRAISPDLDGQLTNDVRGFSVTPDGRWIVYARVDAVASDIIMVENFR